MNMQQEITSLLPSTVNNTERYIGLFLIVNMAKNVKSCRTLL